MTPDDMPWIGSHVLRAPTWLRRITVYGDSDAPVRFAEIVGRFRALEHLDAPLEKDAPVAEQIEALVAKQSGLRSLELGHNREGARTAPLADLPLEQLGCSARLLGDAAGTWSEGLREVPNLRIYAREVTAISGPGPWERLRACESLELRRVELDAGTLAALATLPSLRRLNLSLCSIKRGSLAALGACPALERLTISGSTISAADASALASAPKLRTVIAAVGDAKDVEALRPIAAAGVRLGLIFLPRNEVNDGLIASICANLSGLAGLRLSQTRSTKLTPGGLAQIGGLSSLRWLDLSGLVVRGLKTAHLGFLAGLGQLRSLSLSDVGKTSAAVVDALVGATELRTLDLRDIPMSDAAAKKLSQLDLRWLAISEAKIGAKGVAALASMRALEELSIKHAKGFSDAMLAALAPAPALERLDLETSISAAVHPSHLAPLAKLPRLRSLGVAEVGITDAWLESLSAAPALEALRITRSDCSFSGGTVTDASVQAGCKAPALRTIAHWSYIPSAEMQGLIESAERGAWTPADYRSVTFPPAEVAPLEG